MNMVITNIMDLVKKASCLKGLLEGLAIDKEEKEGKIMYKIMELLDDMCEEIDENRREVEEIWNVIDELDEDLKMIEDDVYNDGFYVKCPNCEVELFIKYTDLGEKELEDGAVACSNCGFEIRLDDSVMFNECDNKDCNCEDDSCNCSK